VTIDKILLILTTAVSLEAIYLAIFIQMTVNRNTQSIEDIEEDIEDIQEDVEELSEDVEDISEDIDAIQEIPEKGKIKKMLHL
jgi:cell division protein FtsL